MMELTENDMLDIEMRLRRGDIRAADMQRLFDAVKPAQELEDEVDRLQKENDELEDNISWYAQENSALENQLQQKEDRIKDLKEKIKIMEGASK